MNRIRTIFCIIGISFIFTLCQDEDLGDPTKINLDKIVINNLSVANISYRQFDVKAHCTLDKSFKPDEFGICYSKDQHPNIKGTTFSINQLSSESDISVTIKDLNPNTTYYLKAYVKIGDNIIYSDENTAKTVDVQEPTVGEVQLQSKTSVSFSIKSEIIDENGLTITERGICWSENEDPTIQDNLIKDDSVGIGSYTLTVEKLYPNRTYYVKAYAKNARGLAYGKQFSVLTNDVQIELNFNTIDSITPFGAICKAEITSNGGYEIIEKGFCYDIVNSPTLNNEVQKIENADYLYSYTFTNLKNNTSYYIKAFAINKYDTAYSEQRTFFTKDGIPVISGESYNSLTSTSANICSEITNDFNVKIIEKGVCYSLNNNPTIEDSKVLFAGEDNPFCIQITDLLPLTTYYAKIYVKNQFGVGYGGAVQFTTNTGCPYIETNEIAEITSNSAKSGGSKISDSGFEITSKGVCWNTAQNPTIDNNKTNDGTSTNEYTSALTNLLPNTTYYVRAYATNQNCTSYGAEKSFTTLNGWPTVETKEISEITPASAQCGGSNLVDNGFTISAKGVCWATSQNPTVDNEKTNDGSGTVDYTSTITNLAVSTTYYVRAYASNAIGTTYGSEKSFQTKSGTPVLTTVTPANATSNSANSGGNITDDGGYTITERGVCWATTENPDISNDHTSDGTSTGSFTSNITGLAPQTTYYIRAFASNQYTTSYGQQESFTTTSNLPVVTTDAITNNTTGNSATSGGNVTSDNGFEVTARGVCWSTSQNPVIDGNPNITVDGTGTGTFTSNLTGLVPNTTYYVKAYATNANGTNYGDEVSFTTPVLLPVVTTTAISAINAYGATSGGTITSDGGASITARGVCWSTSSNPTIDNSKTTDGTGTDVFTSTITGLNPETTYYVRAYATNSGGTGYGDQITFTTTKELTPLINEIIDTQVHDGTGGGTGNSDYYLEVGENIALDITIKNNGTGTAYNLVGILSFYDTNDGNYSSFSDNDENISSIKAGSTNTFDDFNFNISGMPTDKVINFKLTVTYDDEYGNNYNKVFSGAILNFNVYYYKEVKITDDALVEEGYYAGTNFGSMASLIIEDDDAGLYYSYLKPEALNISSSYEIVYATINLYVFGVVANPFKSYLNKVTDDWSEGLITWNTKPGWSSTTYPMSWVNPSINVWLPFNITSIVKEWVSGTANYGIILRCQSGYSASFFNSTESSNNKPFIKIRYR